MKKCDDCKFCEGYNYDDGTPICNYEEADKSGFEYCPYNDSSDVVNKGMKIEIDTGFMSDYIKHTLINTIDTHAYDMAKKEIECIIDNNFKDMLLDAIQKKMDSIIDDEISKLMDSEIVIGGGWSEPERKVSRKQYISEKMIDEINKRLKDDVFKPYVQKEVGNAINTYDRKLRDEVNAGIKTYFDSATREVLTQNVVEMLMSNSTYKKLSDSMETFLPNSTQENI